ncbi:MAG TPA: metal ABC transporter permease [Acidimicrobiales bacterium]|nr:metal ABC transporter permease [Acidimicrobiales bacterium]
MRFLFEPGFFASAPVRTAMIIGALAAVISAVVGVFTVVRGQSFAGHALTDVATAGGSGAFLTGISPLVGFVGGGVLGAGAMDLIGVERLRSRDVATGIVLSVATGFAALFLFLDTTMNATTGATQQILFGSIFTVNPFIVPYVLALSVLTLFVLGFIYRPLLLSSLSSELASARGIGLRRVGLLFMLALAIAVGVSAIAIGSVLSTALLIGPAATSLRLTKNLRSAIGVACAMGVATTWLGVLLAYDSFYWIPSSQGLPVSFFIVALILVAYLASGVPAVRRFVARPAADHGHSRLTVRPFETPRSGARN